MNDSNRTDPDKSARHMHSTAIDVFNRTVIMTCAILFNRSTRLASQSPLVCSLFFFPLASFCWRTTRLLQHTHSTMSSLSIYGRIDKRKDRQADTKIETVFVFLNTYVLTSVPIYFLNLSYIKTQKSNGNIRHVRLNICLKFGKHVRNLQ
jgi:hypothetical protein